MCMLVGFCQPGYINPIISGLTGPIAQWLERPAHNRLVVGSNPTGPTRLDGRQYRPPVDHVFGHRDSEAIGSPTWGCGNHPLERAGIALGSGKYHSRRATRPSPRRRQLPLPHHPAPRAVPRARHSAGGSLRSRSYSRPRNSFRKPYCSTPLRQPQIPLRGIDRQGPAHIRSDNGPELFAREIRTWLSQNLVKTCYTKSGAPGNAYCESFIVRVGDELLDREIFITLEDAQAMLERFRIDYNTVRIHSALGYRTPLEAIEAVA